MFDKKSFLALLKQKDTSVEEVAKAIGINPVTLYRKIDGTSDFYVREMLDICKFLGEERLDDIFYAEKLA